MRANESADRSIEETIFVNVFKIRDRVGRDPRAQFRGSAGDFKKKINKKRNEEETFPSTAN